MKSHYSSKINSHEEQNNFWLAIASAQFDTNTLQLEVFNHCKQIILSGDDILLWKELKANDSDVQSRKQALHDFLTHLNSYKKTLI